jgi:methionyl-tRNA formyltransferase
MSSYILVTNKPWHDSLFEWLNHTIPGNWFRITTQEEFVKERLSEINPDKVFIPHWSYMIPGSVFRNFECIVFHMTDLPYGRGGSPLQNLISLGYEETKISALRVEAGLDTGPVYLKKTLSLLGTAEEIFLRSSFIIGEMIKEILDKRISAQPQVGSSVIFKRRKPEDSDISKLIKIEEVYDYIRMLDGEGYPPAFIETDHFKFEFSRSSLKSNDIIIADVRITKK